MVRANNRTQAFEMETTSSVYPFPYALLRVHPNARIGGAVVFSDEELGRERFTYRLAEGNEDTIHLDDALECNRDTSHMNDLLVHRLALEAQRAVESSGISKREVIHALGTLASQFCRLLGPASRSKSLRQLDHSTPLAW